MQAEDKASPAVDLDVVDEEALASLIAELHDAKGVLGNGASDMSDIVENGSGNGGANVPASIVSEVESVLARSGFDSAALAELVKAGQDGASDTSPAPAAQGVGVSAPPLAESGQQVGVSDTSPAPAKPVVLGAGPDMSDTLTSGQKKNVSDSLTCQGHDTGSRSEVSGQSRTSDDCGGDKASGITAVSDDPLDPEAVALRIKELRKEIERSPNRTSQAMGLVVSLGVTTALVLYGFFRIGKKVVELSGAPWAMAVCMLIGVVVVFWIGALLIKPIVRQR